MVPRDRAAPAIVARDGTRIGYQVRGERPVRRARERARRHRTSRSATSTTRSATYKTICWDYRGLYTSAAPRPIRARTPSRTRSRICSRSSTHEGVDDVVIAGWSMGVQVAFETIRALPERVRGLLAINGTYGRAFRTVMGSRARRPDHPDAAPAREGAGRARRARDASGVAGSDALISAMKRVGLVSADDRPRDLPRGRRGLPDDRLGDLQRSADAPRRARRRGGARRRSTVPVTIVTGDRDLMTPPATAEHMHRAIRGSRLVVIEGGTHYTPVEYPGDHRRRARPAARSRARLGAQGRRRRHELPAVPAARSSTSTSSARTAAPRSARPARTA